MRAAKKAKKDPGLDPSYDRFVGEFVDALQSEGVPLDRLRSEWLERCPGAWRDRFASEVEEVATLVAAGVIGSGDAA